MALEIDLENISHIEPGAFNSTSFSATVTLNLINLNLSVLDKDIFSGLTSLITMKFYQLQSTEFASGWLSRINRTLENLLVYGMRLKSYDLQGLTSGVDLGRLTLVTYSLNLFSSINENTFTGLKAVHTLELSFCSIDAIGPRSFDPIALTLRLLKLNNNQLKQLPDGLFDKLLPNPNIRIYISDNPFDCSCALVDVQNKIQANLISFVEIPRCYTPFYFYNAPVNLIEGICWNGNDRNRFDTVVKCSNDRNKITYESIQKQKHQSRLVQNKNNSVMLQPFEFESHQLVFVINEISHIPYELNNTLNCWSCKGVKTLNWAELNMMHLYIMCVINPLMVKIKNMFITM